MDGQSLESEFEEQNHNMSSYGYVRVPPYPHSGLVAVITVLRHFQKIRENRGPGSTIRYVVV